jgi:ketosteroid isomerase-like protein
MRATVCLKEIGGRWLIAHEHFSVPFDMQSGKAMFDLTP